MPPFGMPEVLWQYMALPLINATGAHLQAPRRQVDGERCVARGLELDTGADHL